MNRKILLTVISMLFATLVFAQEEAQDAAAPTQKKSIVVYFSHKGETFGLSEMKFGNTQLVAIVLAKLTNSDIFEIEPIRQYPMSLRECQDIVKNEKSKKLRINCKNDKDLSSYETIYFGYPIWWKDMPMICYTFLEHHDLSGKTVVPFFTHSGMPGLTVKRIKDLWPNANVLDPFEMEGVSVQYNPREMLVNVQKYLKENDLLR